MYVKKEEVNWISEHDLSKQGYQAVEANDSVYDLYGVPQFFHTLFEKIDQPEAGQQSGDGKLSPEEVVQANQDVPIRQQINRCLVKFHSEWFNQDNTSPAAQHYLEYINAPTSVAPAKAMAEHQLAMINKLSWLGDVLEQKKGLPESASERVWHMHPFMFGGIQQCLCSSNITIEHLASIMGNDVSTLNLFSRSDSLKGTTPESFLNELNRAMKEYGINSCLQKMHFLSQALIESDNFKTAEEYKNRNGTIPVGWKNYEGGTDFHGRGIIQVTHKANYQKYWKSRTEARDDKLLGSNLFHAVNSGAWYWKKGSAWGDINKYADENDFLKVTIAVNGGFNHVKERRDALYRLSKIIKCSNRDFSLLDFKLFTFENSKLKNSRWYSNNKNYALLQEQKLK